MPNQELPPQELPPQQLSRKGFLDILELIGKSFAGEMLVVNPIEKIVSNIDQMKSFTPDYKEPKTMEELTQRALYVVSLLEDYQRERPPKTEKHKELSILDYVTSMLEKDQTYPELADNKRFLKALKHLNDEYNERPGQAYQCYGVASLMSALFFEKIGKILGSQGHIEKVKDIILPPDFAKEGAGWYSSPETGFVILKLGGVAPNPVYTLSDMMPGDFFVEYKQDSVGHIGFVLDKKIVDGQLYFDVLDANYKKDFDKDGNRITIRDGHIRYRRFTPEEFEKEYTDGTGVDGSIALLAPKRR